MSSESPESTRTEFTLNDEENLQSSCWPRRIPLRMGLILMLSATLPFFVALTTMFVLFGTVWNKSEKCEVMCNVMEDAISIGGNKIIIFDSPNWGVPNDPGPSIIVPSYNRYESHWTSEVTPSKNSQKSSHKKLTKEQIFCPEEKSRFPFVAALLENLYVDDGQDQVVKCPVALLSKKWVLATEQCAGDFKTKMNFLSVRINSDYWAKGGIVKKIRTMMSVRNLIAIQVERLFGEKTFCYNPVKIRENNELASLNMGYTFKWNSSFKQPLKKRNKFTTVERVSVKLRHEKNFTLAEAEANAEWDSSLLFDQNENYLVGFWSVNTVNGWSIVEDIGEYVPWLQFIGAI